MKKLSILITLSLIGFMAFSSDMNRHIPEQISDIKSRSGIENIIRYMDEYTIADTALLSIIYKTKDVYRNDLVWSTADNEAHWKAAKIHFMENHVYHYFEMYFSKIGRKMTVQITDKSGYFATDLFRRIGKEAGIIDLELTKFFVSWNKNLTEYDIAKYIKNTGEKTFLLLPVCQKLDKYDQLIISAPDIDLLWYYILDYKGIWRLAIMYEDYMIKQ